MSSANAYVGPLAALADQLLQMDCMIPRCFAEVARCRERSRRAKRCRRRRSPEAVVSIQAPCREPANKVRGVGLCRQLKITAWSLNI